MVADRGAARGAARSRLEAERSQLLRLRTETIDLSAEQAPELDGPERSASDLHSADAPTNLHERERDHSVIESVERELTEIDAAFERLDDGSYGRCEVCGTEIDDARLEAVPATRFCVEHQRLAERTVPDDREFRRGA